ncbi:MULTISPECIES: hypothetical protein [Micrococcaceae]|uniref:MFS transporter n=1 Tax=Arthrobacter sedimenti TaxID=2694931 RepID=A0ABV8WGA4_9MICC|nr:hypothetical protein [Pseudarthrobacter defluvii]WJH26472.1 hypothetical protein JCQ34_12995 [Pseudarthrobacter defluvii]
MILVVAVALWIVWVAPYVLRNRRHQFQPAGDFLADAPADERPDPHPGLVLNVAAQQEKAMEPRKSAAPAAGTASTPPPARFRVRYGRTALALVGLLSLVTAFISGVLLPFGVGSPALPLTCTLLTVASVALLRWLAVRDRKAKVNAAFRSAMSAPARRPEDAVVVPAKPEVAPVLPESTLFDAEAGQAKVKPLTAVELREAALAVAVAAGDTSAAAPSVIPVGTPWEPVEVPKPVYVEAAKAERPEPEPLELPEAPKAVGKPSLKKGAAGAPSAEAGEAEQLSAQQLSKAQSALSNLDDVLQRRRA